MTVAKCSATVLAGMSSHSCNNKSKVLVDGKWYCGVHDPQKRKDREAKQDALWAAQRTHNEAQRHVKKACDAIVSLACSAVEMDIVADSVQDFRTEVALLREAEKHALRAKTAVQELQK